MSLSLLTAVAAVLGVVSTAVIATRDLRIRRQTETMKSFLDLVSHADARPRDGRTEIGWGEQVAAVRLLGTLGRQERWLRTAAIAALLELSDTESGSANERVRNAAASELSRMPADMVALHRLGPV